jgi:hypothetical protein
MDMMRVDLPAESTAPFRYRPATLDDIPFLVSAIIEAERSATPRGLYERVFDLDSKELSTILNAVLEDDVEGCELCPRSFHLAFDDTLPVACMAAWVEADGAPASNVVRMSQLSFAVGPDRWRRASARLRLLAEIEIPREPGALELESVYVANSHRGRGVIRGLFDHVFAFVEGNAPEARKAQMLTVVGNASATSAFARSGFAEVRRRVSSNPEILEIFPGAGRILWERPLSAGRGAQGR